MLEDSKQLDVLGSWLDGEMKLRHLFPEASLVMLPYLEPFHSSNPWSRWLKGKHVLVIHPFAHSIISQYGKRESLFKAPDVLPEFKSLRVIKAVQSLGGNSNGFDNWFEALDWMKSEMDKAYYDIALIGCGAYGFPLAAHAKRTGHQAIHMGGALQLMFGIKGKRWEGPGQPAYWKMAPDSYKKLFNEYWVNPSVDERPRTADSVEDSPYW